MLSLILYIYAAAKSLQSCPTLCHPIDGSPPGSPRPWDSPSKNTGVGCHFLLQYMKVKIESEVAQSCPTLGNPMDCSPPGSSVHGIFPGKSTGVGCHCLLLCVLRSPQICGVKIMHRSPCVSPRVCASQPAAAYCMQVGAWMWKSEHLICACP